MQRVLSLYLPYWPTDCLLRQLRRAAGVQPSDGRGPQAQPALPAVVLTERVANRQVVGACCRRGRSLGVRVGMSAAHARALLCDVEAVFQPRRPHAERRGLDALAQWALRFSPLVQVDGEPFGPSGGLLIDITGCQRLFGGEDRLMEQVGSAAGRLGLAARLACSDTVGCSWAVARFGRPRAATVPPGRQREALGPLPARALRLGGRVVEELAAVGVRTAGQVLDLPASALAQRFGRAVLGRIEQALGDADEPVEPLAPVHTPSLERILGGPTRNLEAIRLGVRHLLDGLVASLGGGQLGVLELVVVLRRSDSPPVRLSVPLSHPSGDAGHLWTLLSPALERANMGFGVEAIEVLAPRTAQLRYSQLPLLGGGGDDSPTRQRRELGRLVDVLSSRLGSQRVTVAEVVDSHVPELGWLARPACEAMARPPRGRRRQKKGACPDRPSVLLDRPQRLAVTVLSPDGPVVGLTWGGQASAVRWCVGPERIAGPWWNDVMAPVYDKPQATFSGDSGGGPGGRSSCSTGILPVRPTGVSPVAGGQQPSQPTASSAGAGCPCDARTGRPCHTDGGGSGGACPRKRGHGTLHGTRPGTLHGTLPGTLPGTRSGDERDYYKLQDERGRWLWLFRRRGSDEWFLHGIWQ